MLSGNRKPPQARDRVLGAQLRALRLSHTSLGLEEAARAAQVSPATMSRTENGKRHITVEDVAVLCTLYGVPAVRRSALVEATKAPSQAGWWERHTPGMRVEVSTLASYESVAKALTNWSITIIPGLLQTRDYAMGVLAEQGVLGPTAERQWEARERRQQVLARVEYTAYIHELALRTPFGGAEALRGQLIRLGEAVEQGVNLRVVRACVPLGALAHSWMMLEFLKDEPIVHVELLNSALYLHVPALFEFGQARQELAVASLSGVESRKLIARLVERL